MRHIVNCMVVLTENEFCVNHFMVLDGKWKAMHCRLCSRASFCQKAGLELSERESCESVAAKRSRCVGMLQYPHTDGRAK